MKTRALLIIISLFIIACSNNTQTTNNDSEITPNNFKVDSLASCSPRITKRNIKNGLIRLSISQKQKLIETTKRLNPELPIIGLLMYDNVLTTELTAPMDVFTKNSEDGKQLFNVITIAETYDFIVSEEGLKMFPDYILENSPKLDILIVPSAYDMSLQIKNKNLIAFIKSQNNTTKYTVSNCAGATLIGESGIADGKKIVTWIGGGDGSVHNSGCFNIYA